MMRLCPRDADAEDSTVLFVKLHLCKFNECQRKQTRKTKISTHALITQHTYKCKTKKKHKRYINEPRK